MCALCGITYEQIYLCLNEISFLHSMMNDFPELMSMSAISIQRELLCELCYCGLEINTS